jgi:serine/threonine-protein kinase
MVHRDVKPQNVLIDAEGRAKVTDFGIARQLEQQGVTDTGRVLGTTDYVSPEQAMGHGVDARSDIYSLGVVLYEMLTGRPPFTGDSPMAIAYKQVNEAPPAPSTLNEEVPPELDAVVMRALSKNPANRYQTAQEFAEDLERARTGGQVSATPLLPVGGEATQVISRPQPTSVLPPGVEPPGSSRKAWVGALLAVLIMALLAAAAYLVVTMLTDEGGPELVTMPDLVGMQRDAAERRLQRLDLDYEVKRRPTDQEEPGIVVDQLPREGNQLDPTDPDTQVTIWVSVPPRTFPVPDVRGMTVGEAEDRLTEAGFDLGSVTEEAHQFVEEDHIISQTPEPFSEEPKGTVVNVVVSTGPSVVILPDVTCRSVEAAQAQLTNLGLQSQVGDDRPPNAECPNNPDLVAATDPGPGAQVDPDQVVILHQGTTAPSPTETPSPTP